MPIMNTVISGGGTTPTGTKSITINGVHDVTNYASADVQVPTTAPDYYILKTKDANNKLQSTSNFIDLTGITDIGYTGLCYAYYKNTGLTGALDLSMLQSISGTYGMYYCFTGCTGITSVDLSGLKIISGMDNMSSGGCYYCFQGCTGITSINLSNLEQITGCAKSMFDGCTNLANNNLDLSKLKQIKGYVNNMFTKCKKLTGVVNLSGLEIGWNMIGLSSMFSECSLITGVNMSNLYCLTNGATFNYFCSGCSNLTSFDVSSLFYCNTEYSGWQYCFQNCTSLQSLTFPRLAYFYGTGGFQNMCKGCTSLQSVSFGGLPYNTTIQDSYFNNMLSGCSGVTVHFPSDWQTPMSSWSSATAGFGGANTTILFDLPAVTILDFPDTTELFGFTGWQYNFRDYPNITKVDFSGVVKISGTLPYWFAGISNLTTVDFSDLEEISGINGTFQACSGLTTVTFPKLKAMNPTSSSTNSCVSYAFGQCSNLTDIYFPALEKVGQYQSANVFENMLIGCSGVTVHFPSNFFPSVTTTQLASKMSGTNTTVLKDLPATA